MRLRAAAAFVCCIGISFEAGAEGDTGPGSDIYKKCTACHIIAAEDGGIIRKGGKLGPNLYGIGGSRAASVEGFKYGSSLAEARDKGLVWTEENFVAYVENPRRFLESFLGTFKIQNKMAYKLPSGGGEVFEYLSSLVRPRAGENGDGSLEAAE